MNDPNIFESRDSSIKPSPFISKKQNPTEGKLHPKKQKSTTEFLKREKKIENRAINFVFFRIVSKWDSNLQADASIHKHFLS